MMLLNSAGICAAGSSFVSQTLRNCHSERRFLAGGICCSIALEKQSPRQKQLGRGRFRGIRVFMCLLSIIPLADMKFGCFLFLLLFLFCVVLHAADLQSQLDAIAK